MQPTMTDPASATGGTGQRPRDGGQPTMTSFIHHELSDFDRRPQRRARILGRLIFLQIALLLMTAPLAVVPTADPVMLTIVLAGLVWYIATWVRSLANHVEQAVFMLMIGSGIVTAAEISAQVALHQGQILPIGLASLPFLLTIVEAGLLLAPEATLLVSFATTGFTALALIAAIVLAGQTDLTTNTIYLLAVSVLGLQALTGIIAWQVASFIYDISIELRQARREAFIVTQYDALTRTMTEQEQRMREQVMYIIQAIVALSSRDYTARVTIMEGLLKPLADAVNILAAQLSQIAASEQSHANMDSAAMQIADIAGQLIEGDPAAGGQIVPPAHTTGSMIQSAIVALHKASGSMQRRLGQVRDLALDAGQRLNQVDEHTQTINLIVNQVMATIGLLRAEAERVNFSATRLDQLIMEVLRALSPFMPPEVVTQASIDPREPHPTTQQVMPGVTIQLEAITDDTDLAGSETPPRAEPAVSPAGALDPSMQMRLREAWQHVIEMVEEVAKQTRDSLVLQDKLGVSSKTMNSVEDEVRELRNMLANIRHLAEQLYHIANTTSTQPLGAGMADPALHTPPPAPPATPEPPARGTGDASPPYSTGQLNAADLLGDAFIPPRNPDDPPNRT